MAITVLPSDDFGAQLRQTLILNQDQPPRMRPHYTSDFIRTGLFGEKSKVECTLLLPDTVSLPAFTPVPFRLEIMTTTKLMDNDEPKDKTCIFPSPPAWLGIEWYCKGYSHIYVNKHWRSLENHPDTEHPLKTVGDTVRQFPFEPVWMPETADQKAASKGKGRWKQQVQFAGQFSLNVTPTFTTTILSTDVGVKYTFIWEFDVRCIRSTPSNSKCHSKASATNWRLKCLLSSQVVYLFLCLQRDHSYCRLTIKGFRRLSFCFRELHRAFALKLISTGLISEQTMILRTKSREICKNSQESGWAL